MEQVGCKECTSPDCRGCNLLRLEQMLKSGNFDALMDEKRGIKTGIDVRPTVKAEWLPFGKRGIYGMMYACSSCRAKYDGKTNFCPNCGADMREE